MNSLRKTLNDPQAMTPRNAPGISHTEFVALMAMLTALVAFSIDAMLPALPRIAKELSADTPNQAQLIVIGFVLGMGLGTFVAGPLSDSFGRKPVLIGGAILFVGASILASMAGRLDLLILARVLQGLGAAAARVIPMAVTRDFFSGREMARINSYILMVFTLVPAVAPLVGSLIIAWLGWRGLFASFACFAVIGTVWFARRISEPLARENRQPFRLRPLRDAIVEVLTHPVVRRAMLVMTLVYTSLFASLSSIHPIFDDGYQRSAGFPLWFALIALSAGGFSLLNARVVMRLGMRRLIRWAIVGMLFITLPVLGFLLGIGTLPFTLYFLWQMAVFVHVAMTLGNLMALALEPMGHIAGTATSAVLAIATLGSVLLSVPIVLMFDGTPLALMVGVFGCVAVAWALLPGLDRGAAP